MDREYDLIVIGAGPAGTPAAMAAAQFGKKVLLIDKRSAPGGECLFEGCIPSKVLENAANEYEKVVHSKKFHIDEEHPQIHWEDVLKDKDLIIKKRSMGALMQIEKLPTLSFEQGNATFMDANTIKLNDRTITFTKALIATGAKTALPPLSGNGIEKAWTNRDIFFEESLPKEILFIGAGAISCELAQMFNKLGVKTHILERSERILKHLGEEAALMVQNKMVEDGVTIDCNVTLKTVDYTNDEFTVTFTQERQERSLVYENVLLATGRVANLDGLGLENAGVDFDKHGVKVNERLQSSQEHIYACGDALNAPKFAHTATYEAGIVVHNMFAPSPHFVDYEKNSWVLFSDPQIAVVGLDEAAAKTKGLEINVAKYDFAQDARAQLDKNPQGYLKYIIDKETKVIVGVEIVSEDAASLIGEASLIVANKMSSMDVMKAIHPHPTLTESFATLAKQIFFQSMMRK